ncbi:MAG: phosphatidylserine/phosphatidylglycerophosphate/cardiolipin synthase-like enzyme [Psychroserpens sp.]|jgi:phosphatidylserine/phosphatidylglycerophosphate/cardiolipin synthase-like enzyme
MDFNDIYVGVKKSVSTDDIEIHFDNIEEHIVDLISDSTLFFGCAYTFSNKKIIEALSKKKEKKVCIILDKSMSHQSMSNKSKKDSIYDALEAFDFDLQELGDGLFDKDEFFAASLLPRKNNTSPIRVFGGVASYDKQKSDNAKVTSGIAKPGIKADFKFPALHHKFLVCCDKKENGKLKFNCVITGSFNFSANAPVCMENIVVIKNEEVVLGFYEEWRRCFIFSEDYFNYDHKKMTPEHISDENYEALLKRLNDEDNVIIDIHADMHEYLNDFKNGAFEKY